MHLIVDITASIIIITIIAVIRAIAIAIAVIAVTIDGERDMDGLVLAGSYSSSRNSPELLTACSLQLVLRPFSIKLQ